MDVKTLTDEELSTLKREVLEEIEARVAAVAAPTSVRQAAERAINAGVSVEDLRATIDEIINSSRPDTPPTDPGQSNSPSPGG